MYCSFRSFQHIGHGHLSQGPVPNNSGILFLEVEVALHDEEHVLRIEGAFALFLSLLADEGSNLLEIDIHPTPR